jgi:hypothetical protein
MNKGIGIMSADLRAWALSPVECTHEIRSIRATNSVLIRVGMTSQFARSREQNKSGYGCAGMNGGGLE